MPVLGMGTAWTHSLMVKIPNYHAPFRQLSGVQRNVLGRESGHIAKARDVDLILAIVALVRWRLGVGWAQQVL